MTETVSHSTGMAMACLHLQVQHSWLSSLAKKPSSIYPSKNPSAKLSFSISTSSPQPSGPNSEDPRDAISEKAKGYEKSVGDSKSLGLESSPVEDSGVSSRGSSNDGKKKDMPDRVRLAMEKAKEYKKNKGIGGDVKDAKKSVTDSGTDGDTGRYEGSDLGDKSASKKDEVPISSIDFLGLDFGTKKRGRGVPAGLVPVANPFPEGELPEVEIIVGDTSKFGYGAASTPETSEEENADLYKPKVSTWGVFPRPGNISKAFGGGKTIRPGDVIETKEERASKDESSKKLLAAYREKIGLNIDPELKLECEKILKDGNSLMDSGYLKDALPYYQQVMDKLPFKSELHGLAALQWSICQDSLCRANVARVMYEKLQNHPNADVSKRAKQYIFSFQAMEMMKVTGSNFSSKNTGYKSYFEAFIEDKTNYSVGEAETEDGALLEALPYMVFLASPILLVLLIAVQGGKMN